MLFYTNITRHLRTMQIPVLSISGYYNFLSGLMITLFILSLIVVFVYEYEVLRRPKA
jgi:hypothetical protein